jgi:hypothetical protein
MNSQDPEGADERASRRDILEFDALAVGIAEIPPSLSTRSLATILSIY